MQGCLGTQPQVGWNVLHGPLNRDWMRRLLRWAVMMCCVEFVRANLMGILDELQNAQVALLVVGTHAPNNYGPDYKQQFDQIFPELADKYGALYIPSFFEPFITDGQLDESASQYFQPDGIHPNATGVKMVVESVGPIFMEMITQAAPN
jgi:acyl-CoA thioesterase-1